eukprot:409938-Rhodomonas_salina.1
MPEHATPRRKAASDAHLGLNDPPHAHVNLRQLRHLASHTAASVPLSVAAYSCVSTIERSSIQPRQYH